MTPSDAQKTWHRRNQAKNPRQLGRLSRITTQGMAAAGGSPPNLSLERDSDTRSTIISGSAATLLHAVAIMGLTITGALAPAIVEELVTPVKILRELPGSNAPARGSPRPLAAARPTPAPVAARTVAKARPVKTTPLSAEALKMSRLEDAQAPRQLDRNQADSKRVDAQKVDEKVRAEVVTMSELQPIAVSPSDFKVPVVEVHAPRQIAPGEVVELSSPQAFEAYGEAGAVEYSDQAASGHQLASDTVGVDSEFADVGIDTGSSGGEYGVPGGAENGTPGTVSCLESVFVDRYLQIVKDRTYAHWLVPRSFPIGAKVVLRFELDASGSATHISAESGVEPTVAASAVQALRSASPFPPMNEAVRCLDGKTLKSVFVNQSVNR